MPPPSENQTPGSKNVLLKVDLPANLAAWIVRGVDVDVGQAVNHVGQLALRQYQRSRHRPGSAGDPGKGLQHTCGGIRIGRTVNVSSGGRRRQTRISDVVGELVSNQGQQTQSCCRCRDRIKTLVCAVQCGDQQCGRDLAADFASAVRVCVNIGVLLPLLIAATWLDVNVARSIVPDKVPNVLVPSGSSRTIGLVTAELDAGP